MLVACVLIDHFPFKLEARRDPCLTTRPVIVFKRVGSLRTVLDVSSQVQNAMSGMPLQEALANSKDAILIEADMSKYERAFEYVLFCLSDWSPMVEGADLECIYLGLKGIDNTYGSEERLIAGLQESLPRYLQPRLGVSVGKHPAYLAALRAEPGSLYRTPDDLKEFVAPFSVDVLPVPRKVKLRLHAFGLNTLERVASLPLSSIQAQFGPISARMWNLARGIDDTPLLPHRFEKEVSENVTFSVPISSLQVLLMAVDVLLGRLFARPEMRGRFTRTALFEGYVLNGPTWQRRIVFKSLVGDKVKAYSTISAVLEKLALPGPLESVALTFKDLAEEAGRQESLFQDVRRKEHLREAIKHIKLSQRRNPICQVREVEVWSRIPERRRALVPYEP